MLSSSRIVLSMPVYNRRSRVKCTFSVPSNDCDVRGLDGEPAENGAEAEKGCNMKKNLLILLPVAALIVTLSSVTGSSGTSAIWMRLT